MKDREYEKQKRRVRSAFDAWIPRLRLQGWKFDFNWHREGNKPHETDDPDVSRQPAFTVSVHWQYIQAFVDVDMPQMLELSDDELESNVVHELVHVHLEEMAAVFYSGQEKESKHYHHHTERVTESLARAFIEIVRGHEGRLNGGTGKDSQGARRLPDAGVV